jgi:miniconductance mechanosensitive channel
MSDNFWGYIHDSEHTVKLGCTDVLFFIGAILLYFLAWWVFTKLTDYLSGKKRVQYQNILSQRHVQRYLALIAPGLVLYYWAKMTDIIRNDIIETLFYLYIHIVILVVLDRLISSVNEIYNLNPMAEKRPIKGYVQFSRLVVYIIGLVIGVAILSGRPPWKVVTGLGALAAIVMLIFKNTILSFVASMQIFTENTFQLGDWVAVPGTGADGTIIDISLHSVKIQNFDKTVVSIPTHLLMDIPTINWQDMIDSGMRRIERAVFVDQHSIRFCDDQMLDRLEALPLIADDIRQLRRQRTDCQNGGPNGHGAVKSLDVNNFSLFRTYVKHYLRRHPGIRQDAALRIMHLDPTPTGIPLQIYAFTNTSVSTAYDAIQADIFDHILIMIRKFDLRIYQRTSDR